MCDKCGVNFAKVAALMVYQAQLKAEQSREARKSHNALAKEILLAVLTGGLSLLFKLERHKE